MRGKTFVMTLRDSLQCCQIVKMERFCWIIEIFLGILNDRKETFCSGSVKKESSFSTAEKVNCRSLFKGFPFIGLLKYFHEF